MVSLQQSPEPRSPAASPIVGTATAVIDRQAALKRQLQWRMGLAGLLAMVLLVALVLLDYLSAPDEATVDSPQFSKPVAVRKSAAKAVEPVAETPPVQTVVAPQASGAAIERSLQLADSRLTTPVGEAPPVVDRVLADWPRGSSGHLLQSGVFPELRQAEEWQAKLLQEGIPARVETRLQVGPFRTRAEADAARRKLKALGMDGLIVGGKGSRP